jgi:hypothetical protein
MVKSAPGTKTPDKISRIDAGNQEGPRIEGKIAKEWFSDDARQRVFAAAGGLQWEPGRSEDCGQEVVR